MQPQHVTHFLEALLGSSWQPKTFGLLLILLGIILVTIGSVFSTRDFTKEVALILITNGGIAITTGFGFLVTRSHAASKAKAAELEREIVVTRVRGDTEHAENVSKLVDLDRKVSDVPIVVAEAMKPVAEEVIEEAKAEARKVAATELHERERRGLR